MTILGTIALIVLVILSVVVLRVKSDPMEKKSIRKYLADSKHSEKPSKTEGQKPDTLDPRRES